MLLIAQSVQVSTNVPIVNTKTLGSLWKEIVVPIINIGTLKLILANSVEQDVICVLMEI